MATKSEEFRDSNQVAAQQQVARLNDALETANLTNDIEVFIYPVQYAVGYKQAPGSILNAEEFDQLITQLGIKENQIPV